eukprot:364003-Chlamydomonas_euryale.AAC.28
MQPPNAPSAASAAAMHKNACLPPAKWLEWLETSWCLSSTNSIAMSLTLGRSQPARQPHAPVPLPPPVIAGAHARVWKRGDPEPQAARALAAWLAAGRTAAALTVPCFRTRSAKLPYQA